MSKTLLQLLEGVRPALTDEDPDTFQAIDDLDEAIAILRACGFERLGIAAPSHLTIPQAARALQVTRAAIRDRVRRGNMRAETFHGTKMIHISQVLAVLDKRRRELGHSPHS